MKTKFLILIVSLVVVLSASMAVYNYAVAQAGATNSASSTAVRYVVITPTWNSTVEGWIAKVAGWTRISVQVQNDGGFVGLGFANSPSGFIWAGNVGGCLGGGTYVSSFFGPA